MSAKKKKTMVVFRRFVRRVKSLMKRKNRRRIRRRALILGIAALLLSALMIGRNMQSIHYAPLLETIAAGESKGNYNAYYGDAANESINFTSMTLRQVLDWQAAYVQQGHPSNAVGKYQFIRPTLLGLKNEMRIRDDAPFSPDLQDRMAIRLIERRGVHEYIGGRISREQFAHNLSMEWAALPRVIGGNPAASYYDGDGLNIGRVGVDEILAAIDSLRAAA